MFGYNNASNLGKHTATPTKRHLQFEEKALPPLKGPDRVLLTNMPHLFFLRLTNTNRLWSRLDAQNIPLYFPIGFG